MFYSEERKLQNNMCIRILLLKKLDMLYETGKMSAGNFWKVGNYEH